MRNNWSVCKDDTGVLLLGRLTDDISEALSEKLLYRSCWHGRYVLREVAYTVSFISWHQIINIPNDDSMTNMKADWRELVVSCCVKVFFRQQE